MEQLHMKISDLLLKLIRIFLDFLNIKLGGGQDTTARVASPPPCILDMPCDMLLRSIK